MQSILTQIAKTDETHARYAQAITLQSKATFKIPDIITDTYHQPASNLCPTPDVASDL